MAGRSLLLTDDDDSESGSEGSIEQIQELHPPCFPHRHRILLLTFWAFNNAFMMRAGFNVALVSMVNFTATSHYGNSSNECPAPIINSTAKDRVGDFNWDADIQGVLLGAFFYGYTVTQFPGGLLAERFGAHIVFGLSNLLPGILMILTPWIAHWNVYLLVAIRVLSGCCMGPLYPSYYFLMSRWAPPYERTKLMSIGINGAQIGSVIAFALSGILCNLDFLGGWPLVFYISGGISCIWFIFWCIFASDSPATDKTISESERIYIESTTENLDEVEYHRPPFGSMLKSAPVWALFIMMVTDSVGYYTLFNCAPLFMNQVLKYNIAEDGLLVCMPYIAGFLLAFIIAPLTDYIRSRGILSTTTTRKIFTFIGEVGQGAMLAGIGLVGCDRMAASALMIATVAVTAVAVGGFPVNHLDIAPTYAGTVMGLTNGLSNAAGFIVPVIVARLTHNNQADRTSWQHVFFLMGGINIFGTLVFTIFGSGEETKWSREGRERHLVHRPTPYNSLEDSQELPSSNLTPATSLSSSQEHLVSLTSQHE